MMSTMLSSDATKAIERSKWVSFIQNEPRALFAYQHNKPRTSQIEGRPEKPTRNWSGRSTSMGSEAIRVPLRVNCTSGSSDLESDEVEAIGSPLIAGVGVMRGVGIGVGAGGCVLAGVLVLVLLGPETTVETALAVAPGVVVEPGAVLDAAVVAAAVSVAVGLAGGALLVQATAMAVTAMASRGRIRVTRRS
jgi:hypothetical protein